MRRKLILEAYPVFLLALLLQVWAPVASSFMRADIANGITRVACLPSGNTSDPAQNEAPASGMADTCQLCHFASSPALPVPVIVTTIRQAELRVEHLRWRVAPLFSPSHDPDPNIRSRAPPVFS